MRKIPGVVVNHGKHVIRVRIMVSDLLERGTAKLQRMQYRLSLNVSLDRVKDKNIIVSILIPVHGELVDDRPNPVRLDITSLIDTGTCALVDAFPIHVTIREPIGIEEMAEDDWSLLFTCMFI